MSNQYVFNLGQAFDRVAREHSARTALLYPCGEKVTYEELDVLANRIARALTELGIGKGQVVCLFSNKSVNALASMIACLKIGVAYTNLDISSPWQRIFKMLDRCQPSLVLHEQTDETILAGIAKKCSVKTMDLRSSDFIQWVAKHSPAAPQSVDSVSGSQPAYIMFTSGSTGFPKGAVMSHLNVLNFIEWGQTTFDVTPDDVFTNANPIYFDNSVFDFYTSLFSGATLCPLVGEITKSPSQLIQCVNRLACTVWFSVPSLLVYLMTTKALKREDFSSVTRIVFGGEGFPKGKLKELYLRFGHRARLINVYGPTECTCICSSYVVTAQDVEEQKELAPLGHIAPNFDYYINPVDKSDPNFGELYLFGPNVGLGYYNDEERTRRSFVPHPSNGKFRCITYKTGDLVRKVENGHLHFRGRADNQIKHAGYRIELEEIEAAFNSLRYVNEVGVVYKTNGNGLGQIVAFVHCANEVSEKRILKDIKQIVPGYMVPKKINRMGLLPKNSNGKIDRTQLKELA